MSSDDELKKLKSTLEKIPGAIEEFLKPKKPVIAETSEKSFLNALNCLRQRAKCGIDTEMKIGKVQIPELFAASPLRRGEYVLFEITGEDTVTLEQPYCSREIKRQMAKGSHIFSHTIVGVPRNYIAPVLYSA